MATATHLFPISGFRMWLARSRAWMSILLLIPAAIVALTLPMPFAVGTWGAFACSSLGWLAFAGGALFRWWATLYIGGRKNAALATTGAYSVCRNPLYVGSFLLGLSVAFFCQSWLFAAAFLVVSAFYLLITVSAEESVLQDHFGDRFTSYCTTTPRCLPRLRGHHSPATIEVNIDGLKAELFRSARWLWIPIISQAVQLLRTEAWWPQI